MPPKKKTDFPAIASSRVVIEAVEPEVDGGRFPAKREPGTVRVECDAFADGHDSIAVVLLHRKEGKRGWSETLMEPVVNDRWRARFEASEIGRYEYTVVAWVDSWTTWVKGMRKWLAAGVDVETHLAVGAGLLEQAAERAATGTGASPEAAPDDAQALRELAAQVRQGGGSGSGGSGGRGSGEGGSSGGGSSGRGSSRSGAVARSGLAFEERAERAFADEVESLMWKHADRSAATRYGQVLRLIVDPELARFSAWYELFPRSLGEAGKHGTFGDVEEHLPYVAEMGFDILYLPPIHPIGRTHRKGKNNARVAARDDVGSPWAIGGETGGHKAIHPDLGTLADLKRLVKVAREEYGIEVALDIAFQASPDHPWVKEHPSWFRHRPDGTIAYAENPPKKYEDIYPIDFESEDWQSLWKELESVFRHWREKAGITVFRVDNPHTKSLRFWEWCIGRLKADHPELIFLSEAFTRPKVMYRLAKLGYTQSYTYFAWRRARWELEEYFRELSRPPVVDFFRPNAWPNTPDILTDQLQSGERPLYLQRLVLAATLSANYGIYGPAFELMDSRPREAGKEEYLDSEKYQLRSWELDDDRSIRRMIARINRIRREHPALQHNRSLRFHAADNQQIIAYSKWSHADGRPYEYRYGEERPGPDGDLILIVVNLDSRHVQPSTLHLPLDEWGIDPSESFEVHDLISDARYVWRGWGNYIELNPHAFPAHVFKVRRGGPRNEQARDEF